MVLSMVSLTEEVPKIIFGYYTFGVEPSIKCFNEVIGADIIVVNADSISALCSKPVTTKVYSRATPVRTSGNFCRRAEHFVL